MVGSLFTRVWCSGDTGSDVGDELFQQEWMGKNVIIIRNEHNAEYDMNVIHVLMDGEVLEWWVYEPGDEEFHYSVGDGETRWELVKFV